jgi:hypothetical protein
MAMLRAQFERKTPRWSMPNGWVLCSTSARPHPTTPSRCARWTEATVAISRLQPVGGHTRVNDESLLGVLGIRPAISEQREYHALDRPPEMARGISDDAPSTT